MKKNSLMVGMAAMVAATQLFTACSSDGLEVQNAPQAEQSNIISLTSALQNGSRKASRRATSDPQTTQLNTAVKVGAFGVAGDATITNGNNNQYSVEVNGDLSATAEMTWPATGDVNIYAYAPYQEGWAYDTANSFSVATDQSTEAGYLASDLVYGTPTSNPVSQTEDAIALGFTHKLAKLNITIQKAEGAALDLTGGSVTINNTGDTNSTITIR